MKGFNIPSELFRLTRSVCYCLLCNSVSKNNKLFNKGLNFVMIVCKLKLICIGLVLLTSRVSRTNAVLCFFSFTQNSVALCTMPIHKSKMYLFIKKLSVIILRITPSLLKEYDLDCAPSCPTPK